MFRSLALNWCNVARGVQTQLAQASRSHGRIVGAPRTLRTLGLGLGRATLAQGLLPGMSASASTSFASLIEGLGTRATLQTLGFPASGDFKEMGLLGWFLADLAINVAGWAVSSIFKTEKFYDLLGSVSFLTLTGGSLFLTGGAITPRKILVSSMVGLWAARLGSYLVTRVFKVGKDSRFEEVKHQPGWFLVYWTMQAIWVWVTLLPVLLVNSSPVASPLGWLDAAGVVVYATGLGIEAVADWQKDRFRSNPDNQGKFITGGLWSISRHPNYLGEAMLWWGVFIASTGSFSRPVHYASVVSPVLVFLLLRFVSGVPILERQADSRWGSLPEYQRYKETTPVFFPLPRPPQDHSA